MKQVFIAAATIILLTGCYSNSRNAGQPGAESFTEEGSQVDNRKAQEPNDRRGDESRVSINLRNVLSN
ncbi:MAG TPA: hypothetical protein VK846_16025 [Candidatus Limnocylindria bacterium]|nr:hypothetical protein [Candidatus Limnocylindria bacterium]